MSYKHKHNSNRNIIINDYVCFFRKDENKARVDFAE